MTNYQDNTIKCRCESGFIGEYCEKGRPFILFQKRIYTFENHKHLDVAFIFFTKRDEGGGESGDKQTPLHSLYS